MTTLASFLRTTIRLSALAVILVSMAPERAAARGQGQRSPSVPAIQQQVHDASQRWFESVAKGDAAALRELETEDFMSIQLLPQGLTVTGKPAQLQALQAGGPRALTVSRELSSVKVRTYGNVAVLTAVATFRGADATGKTIGGQAMTSEIWVNAAGQWRIAHFQPMNIPPRQNK